MANRNGASWLWRLAATVAAMSLYNGYPTTSDIGYPTPGSFGTYIEKKGISMVTLEMPSTDAATCWRQNRDALLAAIRLEVKESAGSTT